ncbi:DUF4102 domain-containing protein [Burkholderia sp. Bp8994]|nr:DUF4102 domain-containing protein [Burkholderia sp. Bp8994]RQS38073.1 DUF4102 domain-containing protein [Burkholderia sp. Bp8990]RQZ44419.1 DUF4102 domain-containing protein [Burkholderia sp. Bp9099]
MSLIDFAVRHAKATGKKYTLRDSLGLFLQVTATGGRAWHFRYYWAGKQRPISFGTYPEVSLQEARTMRDEARSQLAKGINPHIERKKKQRSARLASDNTFAAVFEQWLAHRSIVLPDGRQSTLSQIRRGFDNDVLPLLRSLSIYDVTRGHLLEVIQRIEARKSYSVAEKVRTWFAQMFRFALVVVPDLEKNPATDLDVVAVPLPPVEHNPFLRMGQLPAFLQTLRKGPIRQQTTLAIRLSVSLPMAKLMLPLVLAHVQPSFSRLGSCVAGCCLLCASCMFSEPVRPPWLVVWGLTPAQRTLDAQARQAISRELRHERTQITAVYLKR